MKRPLLILAVALIFGELSCFFSTRIFINMISIMLVLYVIVIIIYGNKSKRKYLIVNQLVMIFLLIVGFVVGKTNFMKHCRFTDNITQNLSDGEEVLICGEVKGCESSSYGFTYSLANTIIKKSNGIKPVGTIKLNSKQKMNVLPGYKIEAKVVYTEFKQARNFGNFDEKEYNYSNGIYANFKINNVSDYFVKSNKTSYYLLYLQKAKLNIKEHIELVFKKDMAGVYEAILIGDKSNLDSETKNLFRNGGISHILSISGIHISMLGMAFYKLLRKKFGLFFSMLWSSFFVIGYVCMVGNMLSAQRACYMFFVNMLAIYLGKTYDMISSVSLALILVLYQNPFAITSSSFLLSFGAIISIIYVTNAINQFLRIKNKLVKTIIAYECISISLKPIIAYFYFEVTMYSSILNLLVIPLMSIVVGGGVITVIFSYFYVGLGKMCALPLTFVIYIYKVACKYISIIPFSVIISGKPKAEQLVLFYGILILSLMIIYLVLKLRKDQDESFIEYWKIRYTKKISCIILFVALNTIILITKRKTAIYMLDVGQGECICVTSNHGINILIDAGSSDITEIGRKRIIPFLKASGIRSIDYVFVTHSDNDHISGLLELLDQKDSEQHTYIKNLVLPKISQNIQDTGYKTLVEKANQKKVNLIYAMKGDSFTAKKLQINCISPSKEMMNIYKDRNDTCLVMKLSYYGVKMLLTGDISSDVEIDLVNKGLVEKADILKCAHHGSNGSNSREFLEIIRPDFSIISCGIRNRYGHPGKNTIKNISQIGSNYAVTSECGQIGLIIDTNEKQNNKYSSFYIEKFY